MFDPSFELTSQVSTYLYSVSRFLWNDELKKRKRLPISTADSDIRQSDSQGDEWESLIHQEEKFKKAETILSKIGEKCLKLLKFFYLDNKSMKEIAKKMELSSEKIAKNQKYKCLERAKENYRQSQL
jgi:RNA polymerase sigma factor (sigma-70 family)